jgi:membrane protein implicated in regulation of membrane protease activity
MMSLEILAIWWNLVFVIPFGLGLIFLALQTLGLGADYGHDMDHDFDHDMDHDADHDTDHDSGHDQDAGQESAFWRIASVLGVGQVPVMVVLLTFCFIWGFCGYVLNRLLEPVLLTPFIFLPITLGVTLVVSVVLTGQIAKLVGKIFPKTTTYASKEEDLVGKEAETLYMVDQNGGTIRVRDDNGTLLQYPAYADKEIPANSKVVLVRFDQEKGAFLISAL